MPLSSCTCVLSRTFACNLQAYPSTKGKCAMISRFVGLHTRQVQKRCTVVVRLSTVGSSNQERARTQVGSMVLLVNCHNINNRRNCRRGRSGPSTQYLLLVRRVFAVWTGRAFVARSISCLSDSIAPEGEHGRSVQLKHCSGQIDTTWSRVPWKSSRVVPVGLTSGPA